MFEDSLVESSGRLARRHPWSTAVSFAGQSFIGGILVLISLIYTETLPTQRLTGILEAPPPPMAAAPRSHVAARAMRQRSEVDDSVQASPREIPVHITVLHDSGMSNTPVPESEVEVPDGVVGAPSNAQINELLRNRAVTQPRIAAPKVRLSSGVSQGMLIRKVNPQYPSIARQARIQGTVVLQAVIGKDGTVENLHVESGHPMLAEAAIDAVRQWRYKPYYLNNQPVEVDTEIRVNFTLE